VFNSVYVISEKDKTTGQVSANKFYYQVAIKIKNGKIVGWVARPLTKAEFDKLIGKKPEKKKPEKKKDPQPQGQEINSAPTKLD
jgi:hypothetical protein